MLVPPPASRVTISTRSLWRIRLARRAGGFLLSALVLTGIAASARFAIAPPRPQAGVAAAREPAPPDTAAEGFAALFARRYLTWDAADPLASQRALEPFSGPGIEPDAGLQLPARGHQRVEWVEVVQAREPAAGEHVYTLAAQTDVAGLLYLTVSVERSPDGRLALAAYPSFVGSPAYGPARAPARLREVTDPALLTVVRRTLRNYLAASAGELAADLTSGARVSLPGVPMSMTSMQRLDWSHDGRSVIATVGVQDLRGVHYTLGYELDVLETAGRWEIAAVQMDANA